MSKKSTREASEQNGQSAPSPLRMYILICIVGLMVTSIVGYGFFKGNRMVGMYTPLIDAAMEIKLEATTAHLWFEEIISGDRNEDISEVWKHHDQADWYAMAMLEGGENPEGLFIPLDDPEMRGTINKVRGKLKEFREITQERLEAKIRSGIGTDIDQRYDNVFRSFLREADEVETRLQQILAKDLGRFRFTQVLLIVVSVLLFIAIGGFFRHFDNQRKRHLRTLNETNRTLQESEENLFVTLNSIGDAVIATDSEGRIVRMNPVAEKLTGWNLLEAKGIHLDKVFNIINEETRHTVESPVEKVFREGTVVGLANHTVLISKDGTEYAIEDSGAPIRDDYGNIFGVVLTFVDSTRKRVAEKDLRESNERYSNIFDSVNEAIFIVDFNGNIIDANPKAVEIYGYSLDEFKKIQVKKLIHPDDHHLLDEHTKILEKKGFFYSEHRNVHKDGSLIDIAVSSTSIQYSGNNYLVSIITDISERKKFETEKAVLQLQMQQAQKMEALGTLAGGIAHDFNNILTPIIVHSEMILMDLPENDPKIDSLDQILQAAIRARDLVKQILSYSRQDLHNPVSLKITLVIKEVLKLLRSSIPSTIDLQVELPEQCDSILADPTQIHQILMNLCTNAYHAMKSEGGVLEIKLANVHFEEYTQKLELSPGHYLELTVSDTGSGIPTENLDRIFDPFFTTKERTEGTGMGLSVVHGIVGAMDGAIWVESDLEKGTMFHIYFPIIQNFAEGKTELKTLVPHGTERVLVVDDEEATLSVLTQMLARLGYKVESRSSSLDALELFRIKHHYFDLVITDMTMPNMTGDHLARELLKIRPDIPIILGTGFSDKIDEKKAIDIGIKSFMIKPIITKDLADTIRDVLDKKD